jgi:hypothetical protein
MLGMWRACHIFRIVSVGDGFPKARSLIGEGPVR